MKKKSEKYFTMYGEAPPKLFTYASQNRNQSTPAEELLWDQLKNKQLGGFKFRRQHPIEKFILDFYCFSKKCSIELDGEYHLTPEQMAYDFERTALLTRMGITELRFTNSEVTTNLPKVLEEILRSLG